MKKSLNESEIITLYNKNWSANKIAKHFLVDTKTIINRLKTNNIEIRKYTKKYELRNNYFNKIDTESKAYWLGFLMADGYNSGKYIRIDIKDDKHLEKLRDEVYFNKDMPVRIKNNPNGGYIYYLTIHDKNIVMDCEKFGIVNKKSFITEYPNIDVSKDRDFIRGLFDGDGCLSYSNYKNYRKYVFSIVGSENLMISVRNILINIGVNVSFGKCKSIYRIYITGNRQVLKVLDWLYNDSKVFLDRKYIKYIEFIKYDLS